MIITEDEAQALHDRRRNGKTVEEHDQVGCWCCCTDCNFDARAIFAGEPIRWWVWFESDTSKQDGR